MPSMTGRDIMFPGCPSVLLSFRPSHLTGTTLCAAPSKSYDFCMTMTMHVWQCPNVVQLHLLFWFDFDLHLICSQGHV